MELNTLISYITQPTLIPKESIESLADLSAQFPYCNTFQMLYLKSLQNANSLYFEKQLTKTSLISNDRSKLYQLCYQKKLKVIISEVNDKNDTLKQINDFEENLTHKNSTPPLITNTDISETTASKDAMLLSLEEAILIEAMNQSLQIDITSEINALEKEAREMSTPEEQTYKAQNEIEAHTEIDTSTKNIPTKFSDWLFAMKPNDVQTEDIQSNNQPAKKQLLAPQDLIDTFLKLEDKTIKIKKEPLSPQHLAKLSLVENEDFVTETLANIYAAQGNFLKSIKIYEQLMLVIPEKKVFFASRIRFLKEKIEYET